MDRTTGFLLTAFLTVSVSAAPKADMAALKTYAAKALPRCSDGKITLESVDKPGPSGFLTYTLTLTSTDPTCGKQSNLLYSPSTQQVLIGTMIELPNDSRSVELRSADEASRRLQQPIVATVSKGFPLPDGLKAISLTKGTKFGPFAYHGYVDASEQFLMVANRGNLKSDPSKAILNTVLDRAVRRGNPKAKLQIVELSDFQCPTCGRAHKVVEPLIEKNLKNVDYYRVDLPLFESHEWSLQAALGARAIQKVAPKAYWEYVNYVFGNQELIGKIANFDKVLADYVSDHDLNWPAIETFYRSPAERTALLDATSRIFDLGILSTPTYIINGQIMGYGPEGKFTVDAIKKALAAK